MVAAHLAERPLPTPDDLGSNPAISNLKEKLFTVNCKKAKRKKQETGSGPFKI